MSRVDSVRIAAGKAAEIGKVGGTGATADRRLGAGLRRLLSRSPMGSKRRSRRGSTAVIQPGGSVRDKEVIAAADAAGIAMVFTGIRHFRH